MPAPASHSQGCDWLLGRHAAVWYGPIRDRRWGVARRALVRHRSQEPHSGHDKHSWRQLLYGTLLGCRSSISDTKFDNPHAARYWGKWTHRYPSRPRLDSWPCGYPHRERAGRTATIFFSSAMSSVNFSNDRTVFFMPATSRHFSSPSTFTKTA